MSVQNAKAEAQTIPRLSIGMPVRNGEQYIRASIDSLLNQSFTDFELIISDNASTDATEQICRRYAARDKRVRYERLEENIGAAPNHNRVVELATGKYFKWAAHDDECLPSLCQSCIDALEKGGESIVLAYPRSLIIDERGCVTSEYSRTIGLMGGEVHERIADLLGNIELATPEYGVIRMEALRRTRLQGSYRGSDYVMFLELALIGEIREVPEFLFKKRIHSARSSEAHFSPEEYAYWLDPAESHQCGRFGLANKLAYEYLKAILRIPNPPMEKFRCALTALWVHYKRHNDPRFARWRRRFGFGGTRTGTPDHRETISCDQIVDRVGKPVPHDVQDRK